MSVTVQFIDEHEYLKTENQTMLSDLLQTAAKLEDVEDGEVCITFVNNPEIQELNHTYRGKNEPTDVLSFPMYEADEEEIEVADEDEPLLLGDIVISIPRAQEQAEEYGHSFERELGFLAVHGFLHLLGYDHGTDEEEKLMFSKQEEILKQHGLIR